jgi:hypothetical protein
VKDDFKLELRFEPPDQIEENALRDFVRWLQEIEITDSVPSTPLKDFADAIRAAAGEANASPPVDFMFGSPVIGSPSELIHMHPDDVCEYLRAAFRIWTTELRPRWRPDWLDSANGCSKRASEKDGTKKEDCLLLAELSVPVIPDAITGDMLVQDVNKVAVDEERRPLLIHLRMLQEWLLCGGCCGRATAEGVTDHRALSGLADDDHPQYLTDARGDARYASIRHPHALGDLSDVETGRLTDGAVLTFSQRAGLREGQWIPRSLPSGLLAGSAADGDLTGTYPDPTVARLRGRNVADTAPSDVNEVLTWTGRQWEPKLHVLGDLGDVDLTGARDSHVLTRERDQWVSRPAQVSPGVQNVVRHLAGTEKYEIVAAGIVDGSGGGRPPLYDGINARTDGTGRLKVRFNSYQRPDGRTFQYIVKVLPIANERIKAPIVSFGGFQARGDGFVLNVTDGSAPVDGQILEKLELMIEVSRFEIRSA